MSSPNRPHEPVEDLLGMVVEQYSDGASRVSLTVSPSMLNGHGVCHGGIMFTLADMAMAHATNAGTTISVATHAEVDFFEPVQVGTRLTAEATPRHRRGKQTVTDVRVASEDGTVVAEFRGRTLAVGTKDAQG